MKSPHRLLPGISILILLLWSVTLYTQSRPDRNQGEQRIAQVYRTILDRYVAEIDPQKLSEAAVNGMLHALDPYSQHIDEDNSYRLDAITTGEYGGVGIHLGWMNDSLVVISPMDGTPAFKQGVLAGDRIVKIDSIWTRELNLDQAARLVRGKKGTTINLLIKRDGEQELILFELERELIKVPDVGYSGLLEDRTGYIKLSNFSKYAAEDLEQAVRKLHRAHMNALIIDLRGNPGGLLGSALMSADLFIEKGATLLETRGRIKQSNKVFKARRKPVIPASLPMVVLIDGGSASASEILAGILQDYDRAVIMGKPSYGKGLVQTVTKLSATSRLKLTTAKYYLPSGRLIQKRNIAEDVLYEDLQPGSDSTFYSSHDRQFQGGGGVTPDVEVEALPLSSFERVLWRKRLFFKYALDYTGRHPGLALPVTFEKSQTDSFATWLLSKDLFPKSALEKWRMRGISLVDSTSEIYPEMLRVINDLASMDSTLCREILHNNQEQILSGIETEVAAVLGGNGARTQASLFRDPLVRQAIALCGNVTSMHELLAVQP